MEYCRGRIEGSRERKVPKESDTAGKRSSRSRMEVRLRLISAAYASPARAWSCCLVASSLAASASRRIPCQVRVSKEMSYGSAENEY
jgi:hypothetical protein